MLCYCYNYFGLHPEVPLQNPESSSQTPIVVLNSSISSNKEKTSKNQRTTSPNNFEKTIAFQKNLSEDVLKYFNSYGEAFQDYSFKCNQLFKHLHNQFDGEDKRYYRGQVSEKCENTIHAKRK